ncbi:MAG: M28 family peptidase, partial [Bacteroidia bacterium]|nr:M28 family peptidase [Bacteroidia bacterium]
GYVLRLRAEGGPSPDVADWVAAVDAERMTADLRFLTQSFRHRSSDPQHLEACRDFIRQRLESLGYPTRLHTFDYQGYEGKNYLARKAGIGAPERVLIVDGHYDGVAQTPGADDNATAVVALLEIARILAPHRFRKTLEFAAFDLEESGLVGSRAYVQNGTLENDVVEGALNMEMIGYYSDQPNSQQIPPGFDLLFPEATQQVTADQRRGNFIANVGNPQSKALQDSFSSAAARYVPELKVVNLNVAPQFYAVASDLLRSDHASFWLAQQPAIMLTDGSNFRNPHYHLPSDSLATLNLNFMTRVTQAVLATAALWAEPLPEYWGFALSSPFSLAPDVVARPPSPGVCDFNVMPNPFARRTTLEFRAAQAWTLEIADVGGRAVFRARGRKGFHRIEWDGRDLENHPLPNGVYFVRIAAGDRVASKILLMQEPHAHDH